MLVNHRSGPSVQRLAIALTLYAAAWTSTRLSAEEFWCGSGFALAVVFVLSVMFWGG